MKQGWQVGWNTPMSQAFHTASTRCESTLSGSGSRAGVTCGAVGGRTKQGSGRLQGDHHTLMAQRALIRSSQLEVETQRVSTHCLRVAATLR